MNGDATETTNAASAADLAARRITGRYLPDRKEYLQLHVIRAFERDDTNPSRSEVDRYFGQRGVRLAPEVRVAGLSRDELILALPDDLLRAQPESVIASLSPEAQARVRVRLGR